jgi:hypothetical protein
MTARQPGQVSKAVLSALAAEARSRPGWDEPPHLYFAYVSGGQCRLESARIPDAAWGERPAHDLAALAAATASTPGVGARAKPGLYAVAFRAEAFEFDGAEPGTERFAQLVRDSNAGMSESRPDRREIRAITAIDRTGLIYDVKVTRETGEIRKGAYAPDAEGGHAGTIVNALDLLITALLGVRMPDRRHLTQHAGRELDDDREPGQ